MTKVYIKIFVEGGGDGRNGKAAIRNGMNGFLKEVKEAVDRRNNIKWRLTACGGRDEAYKRFMHEIERSPSDFVVLLVDSEGLVRRLPRLHLQERDHWSLQGVSEDNIHLMIQMMETWIVSDVNTLVKFYGNNFRQAALPRAVNLENTQKRDIEKALANATKDTTTGEYKKNQACQRIVGEAGSEGCW
ncbi:MAG: DUF4276 family protein [Caldilineaceae bacterium SB0665_bin_21]|nr:DUF4276 family protein [Caldilineaceae bacterium SB0665_bin_21]MYA04743.1 DUF4276 family protein [Caldilineaceae bacterium SB0664_bin_22]